MKNQAGTSALKLILIIALGILMAGFISCVGTMVLTGAVVKGVIDGVEEGVNNRKSAKNAPGSSNNPATPQIYLNSLTTIEFPPSRSETIRANSEKAVTQAEAETEEFERTYKKPEECLTPKSHEIRVQCGNHFMRARADFMAKKSNG